MLSQKAARRLRSFEVARRSSGRSTPSTPASRKVGTIVISGPIQVLNFSYFEADFPDTFRTATSIRNEIAERGWNKVVA